MLIGLYRRGREFILHYSFTTKRLWSTHLFLVVEYSVHLLTCFARSVMFMRMNELIIVSFGSAACKTALERLVCSFRQNCV